MLDDRIVTSHIIAPSRCRYQGRDRPLVAGDRNDEWPRTRVANDTCARLAQTLPWGAKSAPELPSSGLTARPAANAQAFGRPGASRGKAAYPQLRFVSLVENGTHVLVGSRLGRYRDGETTLARQVVGTLAAEMLCLADRLFFAYPLWQQARATGADLLWRVKKHLRLPCRQRLADGSYLSVIYPSARDRRHDTAGVTVRVIEYTLPGDAEDLYRVVTSILDPAQAPAGELAALYHERWEIETALDELKTHLRGATIVLRSKTPDLVRQEFYGLLLAHFAIRGLMHEAAVKVGIDPDRLSFVHAVRVIRRKLPRAVAIPPSGPASLP